MSVNWLVEYYTHFNLYFYQFLEPLLKKSQLDMDSCSHAQSTTLKKTKTQGEASANEA